MIEDNTSTDMEVPVMLSSVLEELLRNQRPAKLSQSILVLTLAALLDMQDQLTSGHSRRVGTYSALIARELGLSEKDQSTIKLAGLLHDIGKIGVRKAPLYKPDKLSDEEMHEMKRHVILGYEIIVEVPHLADIACLVLHHHERMDGSGYPHGLSGDEIPLGSRILCVADSFDAMVTSRIYRPTVSVPKALEELERCSGTQFDIEIVRVFGAYLRNEGFHLLGEAL
ncbi:MAG TPA: HD-GYP domain-containing protein [Corynebacteriales bacterium]|nr:HD-GYP domain-containing protein [Mycobacteriales bacterium]